MSQDLIYLFSTDKQQFDNPGFLHNFVKYLFSCSKNHQPNDLTKHNFYVQLDPERKIKTGHFVTKSEHQYNEFKNKFWDDLLPESLENDITHVAFMVEIEGRVVSNMFQQVRANDLQMVLPSGTFDLLVDDYFDGSAEDFFEATGDILNQEGREFVEWKDASKKDRLAIEIKIHKMLSIRDKPRKSLIAVSHHDQEDMYHIHRILHKV